MSNPRSSGVLLHPTSLPGRYGIGDLGDQAYRFVDFLVASGQRVWQVLPLGPTGYGDSPYQCFSAFAGNPLLISPDALVEEGLLTHEDVRPPHRFPSGHVDYGAVIEYKRSLVAAAYDAFQRWPVGEFGERFGAFCREEASWLEDYAMFRALKAAAGGSAWAEWDGPLARHEPDALGRARAEHERAVDLEKFAQFLFFSQWRKLKAYANERGVRVLGDVPIFVAYDSADVWARREQFLLDAKGAPTVVAGVPPDYFSATGQLWGNPLYDWRRMRETGFAWWIERMRSALGVFDVVRLDHFRGFAAYWEIPAGEATAVKGRWVQAPGAELFEALRGALGDLPIVAEDLGVITPDVEALRDRFALPGMHVLQFAFAGTSASVHLPHNYTPNSVVYTGTHDNDTTVGWFEALERASHAHGKPGAKGREEREHCLRYLGSDGSEINWAFVRAAMTSVARTAIVPMQDLLGLDSKARMNLPASAGGTNWGWRLATGAIAPKLTKRLREVTALGGRLADDYAPEPHEDYAPVPF